MRGFGVVLLGLDVDQDVIRLANRPCVAHRLAQGILANRRDGNGATAHFLRQGVRDRDVHAHEHPSVSV